MRRTLLVVLVLVLVFLAGGAATAAALWAFQPAQTEARQRAAPRRAAAKEDRPGAAAARTRAQAPTTRAAPRSARERPAGAMPEMEDMSPEERLQYRKSFRDERLADVDSRLDAYAASAGWDADLTEDVRTLLIETTDGISAILERVDSGESTWEDERENLRVYRYEQAAKLEDLLGEGFTPFVGGMGFTRFLGEASPRDKLQAHQEK